MAKNTETLVQEMLDREEIRTLPVRYCDCVWQKNVDGYANLFTEDGSFGTNDPSLPRAQGRAELKLNDRRAVGCLQNRARLSTTMWSNSSDRIGPKALVMWKCAFCETAKSG